MGLVRASCDACHPCANGADQHGALEPWSRPISYGSSTLGYYSHPQLCIESNKANHFSLPRFNFEALVLNLAVKPSSISLYLWIPLSRFEEDVNLLNTINAFLRRCFSQTFSPLLCCLALLSPQPTLQPCYNIQLVL